MLGEKYLFYLLNELLITYMFIVFFFFWYFVNLNKNLFFIPSHFVVECMEPPPPCLEGSFAISLKVAKLRCFLSLDPVDIKTMIPIKY